ncbi:MULTISPECIES: GH92 family glycosyl hydrolase [Microbacterium]|uniref:Glycoside hydrolase family 92 protein n=1 Tax=Microbacterium wangchenii TaxID=2541726 RepID=A0ABX5SVP1_9MICO|nr:MULTISPECIES: GH92 family glycosyl hydrolase [Microbacterium]MCK6067909.1 GH92 family glycosyl hydrolase [Microbacterium sp. EYE_512]QBR89203.1 glycoside hydrolase family 92 protein [Microbacterium wangchenii]TXK10873.1 glycoside hydrolase family 92 protein [Microbacterium wangchenii]
MTGTDPGPTSLTGRARAGYSARRPLLLDAEAGAVTVIAATELVGQQVQPDTELVWIVLPVAGDAPHDRWQATAVSVDVEFTDGAQLSRMGAVDQYGDGITAHAQGAARKLWPDQWNLRRVSLEPAVGRVIRRVTASLGTGAGASVRAYLDEVGLVPVREPVDDLDTVDTRRGSHSTPTFSRGNTAPLVGLPHGGVFAVPMTDASASDWPYSWAAHNRAHDGRPAVQAFATSHIASPWMGDHGVFQLMPSPLREPALDRTQRALGFEHRDEKARPHLYEVALDGGIIAEIVPDQFAIAARFSFDGGEGSIIVDHLGDATLLSQSSTADGHELDVHLHPFAAKPAYFVHCAFSHVHSSDVRQHGDTVRGHLRLADGAQVVEAVVGLSTVSPAQARENARPSVRFADRKHAAREEWSRIMRLLDVDARSEQQRASLYGGLYRAFLYPNWYSEPVSDGGFAFGSPSHRGRIEHGALAVNNGFWDTYRTAWPLVALLHPGASVALANGFVNHARVAGWTPRWSAPAAEDCMTGTTFDLVFADLAAKDLPGLDLAGGYAAAVKGATVPATDPAVGRKGLRESRYLGWTPTSTHEGLSWSLDNALNDWGIAVLADRLHGAEHSPPRREELAVEREYFARRSLGYQRVFDRERGFFIGRDINGGWRTPFDALEWGIDYTETHAWGTAFTAPHDGAGLVELHGGEGAFGARLDELREIPEPASETNVGHYGRVIHEMLEARDTRMGLLAMSNQPAHHIPFMYMFAGRHDDAHRLVKECLDRLFVGSDFGQGYPGDEDNGEMSAWYLFASLGLYPLVPATGTYVLVPPSVRRAVLRPFGGNEVEIRIVRGDPDDSFISSVRVDGREWHDISIGHDVLQRGCRIDFELSSIPTGWARHSRPISSRTLHGFSQPVQDLAHPARADGTSAGLEALVDDRAAIPVAVAPGDALTIRFAEAAPVSMVTVTADGPGAIDFDVDLLDEHGLVVASRPYRHVAFTWAEQLRPLSAPRVDGPPPCGARFVFRGTGTVRQVEVILADSGATDRR